jgi:Predicted acid phosphatase
MILITNDDGFQSKGIAVAAEIAREFDDIVIVAPDSARSGQSSALTVNAPVMYSTIKKRTRLRNILMHWHTCRLRKTCLLGHD